MQKLTQWLKNVLNVQQGTGRTVTVSSNCKGSWKAGHSTGKA
jgi:hypothetical protein